MFLSIHLFIIILSLLIVIIIHIYWRSLLLFYNYIFILFIFIFIHSFLFINITNHIYLRLSSCFILFTFMFIYFLVINILLLLLLIFTWDHGRRFLWKEAYKTRKNNLKNCSIAIELWWSSALGYIQVSLKKKAAPWYWNEQICHLPWFQVSWPKTYFSLWCVFWSNISKKRKKIKKYVHSMAFLFASSHRFLVVVLLLFLFLFVIFILE